MRGFQFPLEVSRNQYISPFGGFSEEVSGGMVGLEKGAIEKSSIVPYVDNAILFLLQGGDIFPVLFKETFEVMPLDKYSPDAFYKSLDGKVVLPASLEEELKLDHKTYVILNCVLSKYNRINLIEIKEIKNGLNF